MDDWDFDPELTQKMMWIGLVVLLALLSASVPASPQSANRENTPTLKCGKYEHMEVRTTFGNSRCIGPPDICQAGGKPYCADDLHVVTEREWQELQSRLIALDTYVKQSICFNMEWKYSISTDGGKSITNCADLKPKQRGVIDGEKR